MYQDTFFLVLAAQPLQVTPQLPYYGIPVLYISLLLTTAISLSIIIVILAKYK